mmetsp:Transcript_13657/g.50883  ORF Transcript_13657/g.50883 Transcript_13657/m.50883 type:complete len:458 (-) Transcript_13657:563-1936(-)
MADATEPELAEPSDAEEAAHFEEIVMSFCEYGLYMSLEAQRRANALSLLPASARELLPEDAFQNIRRFATECSALNAKFLSAVASEVALGVGFDISGPNVVLDRVHELTLAGVRHVQHALAQAKGQQARGDAERLDSNVALDGLRFSAADVRTAPHQQRKVHQTLHSIVREWTTEGEQERVECFQPLLEELRRHLPVTPDNLLQQKVLVPGCGLGRLVAEIVHAGYRAQGNEFCYQMLLVSDYILNRMGRKRAVICPWIDSNCNEMQSGDNLRTVQVPDVVAGDLLQPMLDAESRRARASKSEGNAPGVTIPPFSMTAGEFLQVYKDHVAEWDAVVTCFFLDTAPRVTTYIALIYRMLKPGGVWINGGPLVWHWAPGLPGSVESGGGQRGDARYRYSVELSYAQVRSIMGRIGFKFLHEEVRACHYACNNKSMMTTQYQAAFFTVQKPEETPESNAS